MTIFFKTKVFLVYLRLFLKRLIATLDKGPGAFDFRCLVRGSVAITATCQNP
jgi:hypothetical protein